MQSLRTSLMLMSILLIGVSTAAAQTSGLFGNNANSPINRNSTTSQLSGGLGQTGGIGGQTGPGISSPNITTELGALSGMVGQGSFVGQGNAAQGFVGSRQAGTQAPGVSNRNFSGAGFQGGGDFNQFNQLQGQGSSSRRKIQPQYRIAFKRPQLEVRQVDERLQRAMSRLSETNPTFAGIDVSLDETGIVALQGVVESDDARRLIEALVRLEPGVRDVTNEIEVGDDPGAP